MLHFSLLTGRLLATTSSNIQGPRQFVELGVAFVLSMIIGIEREIRQKSAGLRTHTLVGVGAALFMLISKYGFSDVLVARQVVVDPSRMAAQIVSGVGFLGAGLIFVKRDSVRGLTTAASVWVTAAIGAASGAGLEMLAATTTVIYMIVAGAFPALARRLPRSSITHSVIRVRYPDGRGILRDVLQLVTARGFALSEVSTESSGYLRSRAVPPGEIDEEIAMVSVTLQVQGKPPITDLVAALSELGGVGVVVTDDIDSMSD